MALVPTVVVSHKEHGKMRINAKDFNPALHKKLSDVHDPNAQAEDLTAGKAEAEVEGGETGEELEEGAAEGGEETPDTAQKTTKKRKKL